MQHTDAVLKDVARTRQFTTADDRGTHDGQADTAVFKLTAISIREWLLIVVEAKQCCCPVVREVGSVVDL